MCIQRQTGLSARLSLAGEVWLCLKDRGEPKLMRPTPAIEVNELAKSFGAMVAVSPISFSVPEGEIFGFLGPNGAGKTTTIKMLCTLLAPTSGSARLSGFDIVKQPKDVRHAIGVIFQDPSLDDRLTALENLTLHAVVYGVPRAERKARLDEALGFVELTDRKNDIVRTFSGGMKRRLEIARGLVHRPRILFLDEPTTGLDPQTRNNTWQVLRTLRERYGLTLFLTTHYMDEAENCDRIAIIDHGKIVAEGSPETLKRRVSKDIVHVRTSETEALVAFLQEKYSIEPIFADEGLSFQVENGEAFIVELVSKARVKLSSIAVRRPTLDDVFLALTGRQIRDESAQGSRDAMRVMARRR